jgi:polyphosphate kinase
MARQSKIINRELSWLSFNERVLQEAQDPNVPLIERLRFLGIFSNNLDEFFKVRVATIRRMIDIQEGTKKVEGERPRRLMSKIQKKVLKLQHKFEYTYQEILSKLEEHSIFIINEKELNPIQGEYVRKYFIDNVLPVLTPIMFQNIDEFPALKDRSIYLATKLNNHDNGDHQYALIEIPSDVHSRFINLPEENGRKFIVLLEDIIRYCLEDLFALFPFDEYDAWTIKITRDAELDMDNDLSKSFLEKIRKGVHGRKVGQPVRFVFDNSIARDLLDFIMEEMDLDEKDNMIPGARYHNFKDFMKFPVLGPPELVFKKNPSLPHPDISMHKSILKVLRNKDILLHVPFHHFDNLVTILREAAIDPDVTQIKITVYRVARQSKIMNALMNAAKNGKDVTVVVELQARFDEESNIYWSRKLEEAGVNVMFGIEGLKVHSKLILISRKENRTVRNYACVGTGNFHEGNASVYTDMFLFTADRRIANEVAKVFEFFSNPYRNFTFRNLLVSPLYQRRRIYKLIDNEIANKKAGKPAYVLLKLNNLVDKDIINKLYQANNEGVQITLICRGICCLRPGIPGISENITATSIVDKYLEHTRIMVFCNNNDPQYYLTSADWMPRNLDRRVEVSTPVYDPELKKEIQDILDIQMQDNVKARIVNDKQDNPYRKDDNEPVRSQQETFKYYRKKILDKIRKA